MATNTEATLAAGTVVEFEFDPIGAPDVYTPVPGFTSLGQIGQIAEAKDQTTLEDSVKRYGVGQQDTAEQTLSGNRYGDNDDQNLLMDAALARKTLKIRVTFPTSAKLTADFTVALLGFRTQDPQAGSEWVQFQIPARQSGAVVWTNA